MPHAGSRVVSWPLEEERGNYAPAPLPPRVSAQQPHNPTSCQLKPHNEKFTEVPKYAFQVNGGFTHFIYFGFSSAVSFNFSLSIILPRDRYWWLLLKCNGNNKYLAQNIHLISSKSEEQELDFWYCQNIVRNEALISFSIQDSQRWEGTMYLFIWLWFTKWSSNNLGSYNPLKFSHVKSQGKSCFLDYNNSDTNLTQSDCSFTKKLP